MEITREEFDTLLQRTNDLEAQIQQVRDGSIVTHISEAIHWKDTSKSLTGGTDYTTDGAWTDLSLKAWTSGKAKFVLLEIRHENTASVGDYISVRKNGETPVQAPVVFCQAVGIVATYFVICAMDSGQVIEYNATDASDTVIDVLGYIE